jgi:membrane protease YdiL (CAAX protease family)
MNNNREYPELPPEEPPKPGIYYFIQYIMYIFMALASMSFLSFAGIAIVRQLTDIEINEQFDPLLLRDDTYLNVYRFMQVLASIGAFVVSSFLYSLYVRQAPVDYLGLRDKPGKKSVFLVLLLMLAVQPATSLLVDFTGSLHLPESFSALEESLRKNQQQVSELQAALMSHHQTSDFLFNIFMMALLPAFAEELFFRKVSLRLLFDWTKNVHASIAISALLFALIHGQVFFLLPLFLFGLLLGYLAYWSGTLWLPVLAHFIHNFFGLSITYLAALYPENPAFAEDASYPLWTAFLSLILSAFLIFMLKKNRHIAAGEVR